MFFVPVKYFVGVIWHPQIRLEEIQRIIEDAFGLIDTVSDTFSFTITAYYQEEMGEGLRRVFYSLKNLAGAEELMAFKRHCCQIENEFFRNQGKRCVNLDPGYLDAQKLVLASNKAGGHKVYLGGGTFADMVLHFHKGSYQAFEWTFPDFKTSQYHDFFWKIREVYLGQRG